MLTDVLRHFRLNSEIYHNAKVCGDWVISAGHLGQTCFHMPTEGKAVSLQIPGQDSITLNPGDIVLFPREIEHSMYPATEQDGEQEHLPYADSLEKGTGMICGRFNFEHAGSKHILDALPPYIVLSAESSGEWSKPILDLIISESYKNGQNNDDNLVLDRLSELIFINALRDYTSSQLSADSWTNILSLYVDPKLAPAIRVIHKEPAKNWTIETLAQQAGMSRTSFANAFKEHSGWTPVKYLTWWRMQLAWTALDSGKTITQSAELVGYQSESAFSHAFKKEFDISAGDVRRTFKNKHN